MTRSGHDNDGVSAAPLGRKALNHRRRQIAGVLVRRGWGYLLEASGLEHLTALEPHLEAHHHATAPERLRLALEELGPTFIKLGQVLSTRADLLGPEFRVELAKLQDDAPHLASDVVREFVRTELGGEPESVFAAFDPDPLAAASIGQAHAAAMPDGTEVVVKIRRPGAMEQVELDLEILMNGALHASRRSEQMAEYDVVGIAEEFAQHCEPSSITCARAGTPSSSRRTSRTTRMFRSRGCSEHTTSQMITLERVRGIKITDLPALDEAGIDRRDLARHGTDVMAKMVFQDRFFHADPHPGNFFIQPGGRIGLIDFGMVGALDADLRDQLAMLMVALVRGNPDRLAAALLGLGAAGARVDRERLRDDLAELLNRYSGRGPGKLDFGTVSGEMLEIVRRHRLRPPRDLALLLRAFVMNEGMAEQLDPDFRLVEELRPYVYRHLIAELSPAALARRAGQAGVDLAELAVDFPEQLHRILELAASGGFEVHLRTAELEPLVTRVERLGNRIAAAVLAAAVVDGLVELSSIRTRSRSRRRPRLSTAVAGLGAFAGDVARSRRRAQVRRG